VHVWAGGQPAEPSGFIRVEAQADGHVMRLVGDVDASVVGALNSDRTIQELGIVAVDVRELGYIDSTGLSLLVEWAQDANRAGRPAVIRHASPRFARVLEMAGLTALFDRES
jgi:anti-anti-sigma factor